MARIPSPYFMPGMDVLGQRESSREAELVAVVNSMGLVTKGDTIDEPKNDDNYLNLSGGEFAGFEFTKPHTSISGFASTRFTRLVVFESTSIVDGVVFENSASSTGTLVKVLDTGIVLFRNCIFDSSIPAGDKNWVEMESGAKCVFSGCMWRGGDGSGGSLVNNAGVAADATVVGCIFTPTAAGAVFVNCSAPVASI